MSVGDELTVVGQVTRLCALYWRTGLGLDVGGTSCVLYCAMRGSLVYVLLDRYRCQLYTQESSSKAADVYVYLPAVLSNEYARFLLADSGEG